MYIRACRQVRRATVHTAGQARPEKTKKKPSKHARKHYPTVAYVWWRGACAAHRTANAKAPHNNREATTVNRNPIALQPCHLCLSRIVNHSHQHTYFLIKQYQPWPKSTMTTSIEGKRLNVGRDERYVLNFLLTIKDNSCGAC